MIPKRIHFIWIQGRNNILPEYRHCVDSWAPMHPDWEIIVWDRETLPKLMNDWVWELDNPTLQCDIARIEVVHAYGGVYFDADTECLKPIDDLVGDLDAFVSMRNRMVVENSAFGATPEHPWLKDMLMLLESEQQKIRRVLDIDRVILKNVKNHPELTVLPFHVFNTGNSERDRVELHHKAHAIHHRFSLWMKDDERYVEFYKQAEGVTR